MGNQKSRDLMVAADAGNLKAVEKLIYRGASANVKDPASGKTALHRAAKNGHAQVVSLLLRTRIPVDNTDHNGDTALHLAAAAGCNRTVQTLLNRGASARKINNTGSTPLHIAAWTGDTSVIDLLLTAGAPVDAKDGNNSTALHYATASRKSESVKVLITRGASLTERNGVGKTAYDIAVENGFSEVMDLLNERRKYDNYNHMYSHNSAPRVSEYINSSHALFPSSNNQRSHSVRYGEPRNSMKSSGFRLTRSDGHLGVRSQISDAYSSVQSANSNQLTLSQQTASTLSIDSSTAFSRRLDDEDNSAFSLPSPRDYRPLQAPPQPPLYSPEVVGSSSVHTLEYVTVQGTSRTVPNVLKSLHDLIQTMLESESMCAHLYDRFMATYSQFHHIDTNADAVNQFIGLVARFYAFLQLHSNNNKRIIRLIQRERVANGVDNLHSEIDSLQLLLDLDILPGLQRPSGQRERDRHAQFAAFEQFFANGLATLDHEFKTDDSQVEALTLLRFEMTKNRGCHTAIQLQLMCKIEEQISALSRQLVVPKAKKWFIPYYHVVCDPQPFNRGGFGAVFHGKWSNAEVVVKQLLITDSQTHEAFLKEVKIWHQLSHPHVVKLYGACHVGKLLFVCEFAANGTLPQFLNRPNNKHLMWHKIYEIALGLQYLHAQNVIHGDLKGNNMLVSQDGTAKLTDFGLSHITASSVSIKPQAGNGASQWKAPEILKGESGISMESDIFSFAMCIVEVASGDSPYGSQYPDVMIRRHVKNGGLPNQPKVCNDQQWALVRRMCNYNPSERLRIAEVVDILAMFKNG